MITYSKIMGGLLILNLILGTVHEAMAKKTEIKKSEKEHQLEENLFSGFYKEYWTDLGANQKISNTPFHSPVLRVNDETASLHKRWGKRPETTANGLALLFFPEDLFALQKVEFISEVWGGHPKTENKRFFLNGAGPYLLPSSGTAAGHCEYTYPLIPIKVMHLVQGNNAFQFICDKGKTFWGHYIVDEVGVRAWLKNNHPALDSAGINGFKAIIKVGGKSGKLKDEINLSLKVSKKFESKIKSVDFYGHYLDYDDKGNGMSLDWHGFSYNRKPVNHLGSAGKAPFLVTWNAGMVPTQGKTMAVRAVVHLINGLKFQTKPLTGLMFSPKRKSVLLLGCDTLPVPFWSRANRLKKTTITIPDNGQKIREALLQVKIWDGGEGTVKKYFTINGHFYKIATGDSVHDMVFTKIKVNPAHLKVGPNVIALLSDTEHHGIEILLPGPHLTVKY